MRALPWHPLACSGRHRMSALVHTWSTLVGYLHKCAYNSQRGDNGCQPPIGFEFPFSSCVCSHPGQTRLFNILVDCFASSKNNAVDIGTYPENFTERPLKDAVNVQIRFTLLPQWINSSILQGFATCSWTCFRSFALDSAVIHRCQMRTNHSIVYMFGRPNSFLIDRGQPYLWSFFFFCTLHRQFPS